MDRVTAPTNKLAGIWAFATDCSPGLKSKHVYGHIVVPTQIQSIERTSMNSPDRSLTSET